MEEALRVLMLLRISRSRPTDKNTEGSIYSAIGRTGRNRYQKEASQHANGKLYPRLCGRGVLQRRQNIWNLSRLGKMQGYFSSLIRWPALGIRSQSGPGYPEVGRVVDHIYDGVNCASSSVNNKFMYDTK